jgi:aminopeptidase N
MNLSHLRRLLPALAALTALTFARGAGPALADTYPRQPGIDILHYAFSVTLRDDSDEIEGETRVDVRFNEDGVGTLALDLTSAKDGKGMTVAGVECRGEAAKYRHANNRLAIEVEPVGKGGQKREFTVKYKGTPAHGLRIGKNKFAERTFFSENWPDQARQWLPTVDHPYDKATSEFIVNAPSRYQVVANGRLIEETDLGDARRVTHWKQSVPIATWLNAMGVAQFASRHAGDVRGVPLEVWSFHQDSAKGPIAFEGPARSVMEFYIDRIGPYPYEKLGNVEAAGFDGGMEHASAIFYGERQVNGKPATELVAHEVAHQWFGDSVTERDWDDVWLSEGFATYFTHLFTEHEGGRKALVEGMIKDRKTVLAFEKRGPKRPIIHENIGDLKDVLSPLVYQKAGWVLHMLRGRVGDEAFWKGIRAYYARHRDGNVSTNDFRRAMEESSGQDLAAFFRQWLNRPGTPVVEGTWRYDAAAKRLEVELRQAGPGEPYRLPLEIGIRAEKSGPLRIEKVELTGKEHRFAFDCTSEPAEVVLDPNTWILMDAKFARR